MATVSTSLPTSWLRYVKIIAPGLCLCVGLGIIALLIYSSLIFSQLVFVNYVLIAIGLGLIAKNVFDLPSSLSPGITFASKTPLYTGIVLLGTRINLYHVFSTASTTLIIASISIPLVILTCGYLAGRFMNRPRYGHLIGVGIGVCGISAILATASAIKARDKEVVTAIGCTLLIDVMMLAILPTIVHAFNIDSTMAGFLSGIVPANTAQCIAIGYACGDEAGQIATVVKSARNALLPFAVFGLTYAYTVKGLSVGEKPCVQLLWMRFPRFVILFLIVSAIASTGLLSSQTVAIADSLTKWLFVIGFCAIGATIDIKRFSRKDGLIIAFALPIVLIIGLFVYGALSLTILQ